MPYEGRIHAFGVVAELDNGNKISIMAKELGQLEFHMIKKGTENEPKNWLEMSSVNDIFQQALLLNKEERKKLYYEFAESLELSVSSIKACEEDIKDLTEIKLDVFRWCND